MYWSDPIIWALIPIFILRHCYEHGYACLVHIHVWYYMYLIHFWKLVLPIPGASLHYFQKRSTLESSIWRDISVYPIRSEIFQFLKIRVSVTNPRSPSSGTSLLDHRHGCYLLIIFVIGSSTKPKKFHASCRHSLHVGLLQVELFNVLLFWK